MKKTDLLISVNGGGGNSLYIKEKKEDGPRFSGV